MKDYLIGFSVIALAVIVGLVGYALVNKVTPLGGIASDPSFSNATSSFVSCTGGASTSSLVQATTTGRTSFQISHTSTTGATYLCRGLTCAPQNGLVLNVNTPSYVQTDGYIGPYSCWGAAAGGVAGGTSTDSLWTSP